MDLHKCVTTPGSLRSLDCVRPFVRLRTALLPRLVLHGFGVHPSPPSSSVSKVKIPSRKGLGSPKPSTPRSRRSGHTGHESDRVSTFFLIPEGPRTRTVRWKSPGPQRVASGRKETESIHILAQTKGDERRLGWPCPTDAGGSSHGKPLLCSAKSKLSSFTPLAS